MSYSLSWCISFQCRITNYLKLIGLKQHSFIIPRFLWVKIVGIAYLGSLLSQQCAKCSQSVFLSAGSAREESTSSLIWLITGCNLEDI